jgi:hypothetical protein
MLGGEREGGLSWAMMLCVCVQLRTEERRVSDGRKLVIRQYKAAYHSFDQQVRGALKEPSREIRGRMGWGHCHRTVMVVRPRRRCEGNAGCDWLECGVVVVVGMTA